MPEPVLFRSQGYTNRLVWEVLPDGAWSGRPAVVIGGGPSCESFDWPRLHGWRSVGVNRCYEFFTPTILFSMDTRFLSWVLLGKYGAEAKVKFDSFPGYKVWLLTYVASLREDIFIIPVFRDYTAGLRAFPATLGEGIGHGNNSGYGALNLAYALGADPIYLLGFDLKHAPDAGGAGAQKTHWHSGHPIPQAETALRDMRVYFRHAADAARQAGREIINLSPDSALDCFPRRRAAEVL